MMSLARRNTAELCILVTGILLVLATVLVSLPLTILTVIDKGGPLGFETMGLAVLVPLCAYIFFGISGLPREFLTRRKLFMIAHGVSILSGVVYSIIFPVYPITIVLIPMAFATFGIVDKRNTTYYLLFMQSLGVTANAVLLFWELKAAKNIPLFDLF